MWPRKIKRIRKKHGLTLQQLADLIGVTHVAVLFWERGKRQPGGPARKALEKLF